MAVPTIVDVSDIHLRDIRFYVTRADGKKVDFSELVSAFSWSDHVNIAGAEVNLSLMGEPKLVLATGGEGSTAQITAPLVDITTGQQVRRELWRGIFEEVTDYRTEGRMERTVIAYDIAHNLSKDEEDLVFTSSSLTQIFRTIMSAFEMPVGTVHDTGQNLGQIIGRGESLWDILQKAVQKHFNLTGVGFRIYASNGRMNLVRQGSETHQWIYEDGWSLIETRRKRSIADVINKVKIYGQFEEADDKAPLVSVKENVDSQSKYGVRQRVDYTSGDNKTEIEGQAQQTLDRFAAPLDEYEVTGWIVPNMRAGERLRVKDSEIGIDRLYFAESLSADWEADKVQSVGTCKRSFIDPELILDEVSVA